MSLSSELISQFAKVTNDLVKSKKETTVYGTVVDYNGSKYVKLDGSDLLTPISTTADTLDGERVTVMIKNHTATVTGNISSPAARNKDVKEAASKISEFEIVIAHKVTTDDLNAVNGYIENLKAITAKFDNMSAVDAKIETLEAKFADIENLTVTDIEAITAEIESIKAEFGEFTDVSTEDLEAFNAEITNLQAYVGDFTYISALQADIKQLNADKLSVKDANIKYANIDFTNIGEAAMKNFYANSGLIENVVISDGTITGNLIGVTIKGDLIEGGTVIADKLVIQGEDGLYYKLNYDGETIEGEQTDKNSLDGSVITAKSITATKIAVDDLVAFDATIGGFNLTSESIYSGVKESADNTTRGIYLDTDGQVSFGDDTNFVRFYREVETDAEGNEYDTYKLEIAASGILFADTSRNIENIFDEMDDKIDTAKNDLSQEIETQKSDYQVFLTKFSKYIRFMEDENGDPSDTAITIGSGDSTLTLELDNETGIIFKKNVK